MLIIILKFLVQFLALIFLMSLEKVIGLPWFSVLIGLIWLDSFEKKSQVALLTLLGLFLASIFNLSLGLSLVLFTIGIVFVKLGQAFIADKRRRFLLASLVINLLLLWIMGFSLTGLSLTQLVLSYFLIVFGLRIFYRK